MSFYVFEHIADPVASLKNAASLLKPNGILYWLIPNFITNPADFIVADHINHFSQRSIETAVRRAGLTLREIDGESHEAAWIVIASREAEPRSELRQNTSEKDLPEQVAMLSRYWTDIETRIRDFEAAHGDSHASIYGSGFYGTFIASRLANFDRISHFIDQNPFRQGRMLLNKPIVAPEQLPEDVQTIYVGLNMQSARAAIADVKCFGRRQLEFLFL
jgi:hypothetical protein